MFIVLKHGHGKSSIVRNEKGPFETNRKVTIKHPSKYFITNRTR